MLYRLNPLSRSISHRLLQDYLELGKYREALALLQNEQIKDSFTRLKLRQNLHLRLGNYDESFKLIQRLATYEGENHELSIKLYRELIKAVPERVDFSVHLGHTLLDEDAQDLRAEGAALVEEILQSEPGHTALRRKLVDFCLETRQKPQARLHLQHLAEDGVDEPFVYLTLAQMLVNDQDQDQAADVLKRMTGVLPHNGEGHLRRARICFDLGRIEEVELELAQAEAFAGDEAKASIEHLRHDLETHRRGRLVEDIRRDLSGGEDTEKRLTLIDQLIGMNRIDEVLKHAEELLEDRPEMLARLQACIEAGIDRTPSNFRLCDYLADLYFRQERYDDLLQLYRQMSHKALEPAKVLAQGCERILARVTDHLETRQELALAKRMQSDWRGVVDALNPLIEADGATPLPAEDKALWVEAAFRQGRVEDAAIVGLDLVDELAAEPGFMLLMIDILKDLGDHEGAWEIYQKARQATPDDLRLRKLARRVEHERNIHRLEELERRHGEGGLNSAEHFEKAQLHSGLDQYEQAIVHYQRAADHKELALPALTRMAAVLAERGMYELATETLEPIELTHELDEQHPDLKEMIYEVARALEKSKRTDQAVVYYKQIFRVDASFRDVVERLERLG